MDTLVVGTDGSAGALAATRWAAKHAQHDSANLVAVPFVPRTPLWSLSAIQVTIDEILGLLRTDLDGPWVAPLRKAGSDYATQLVRGEPAIELLRVANRQNASMLVLGAKGHSGLTDLIV